MVGQAAQKHFMHGYCLLESCQVLSEKHKLINLDTEYCRHILRFKLLLHLFELLCSHGPFSFPKFLKLFSRAIKVWPRRWRWNLGRT